MGSRRPGLSDGGVWFWLKQWDQNRSGKLEPTEIRKLALYALPKITQVRRSFVRFRSSIRIVRSLCLSKRIGRYFATSSRRPFRESTTSRLPKYYAGLSGLVPPSGIYSFLSVDWSPLRTGRALYTTPLASPRREGAEKEHDTFLGFSFK
eukprot:7938533-Pyramimonas_sp.AAC.2